MSKEPITIYEVGPRDGLQYENQIITPTNIAQFIRMLADAGLNWIESGSFVSPKAVPQMAATKEVFAALALKESVHYPVLVPNQKGLEAALDCYCQDLAVFTAASEQFLQANINGSIDESFHRFESIFAKAKEKHLFVRGYVSCAMGCPYEGEIALEKVAYVAKTLYLQGAKQISLADTIGVGVPEAVPELIAAVVDAGVPVEVIALHFHDTEQRLAIPKILAGIKSGIRIIDSAVGNLGGCPYAPGASGNVATELVVEVLEAEGFSTGVDMPLLLGARDYIFESLGRAPGS